MKRYIVLLSTLLLTACATPTAGTEEGDAIVSAAQDTTDLQGELIEDGLTLDDKADQALETDDASENELIPVTLDRVTDGDTIRVIKDGESIPVRLLLIDTPETKHPDKPVQPFGDEASNRLKEFLANHSDIHIAYDQNGEQTDHYDRHLAYVYATDSLGNQISVQEVLLEEGLARVGYIYEQDQHLDAFRAAEDRAKSEKLGIWSIPGYVNPADNGFNVDAVK